MKKAYKKLGFSVSQHSGKHYYSVLYQLVCDIASILYKMFKKVQYLRLKAEM